MKTQLLVFSVEIQALISNAQSRLISDGADIMSGDPAVGINAKGGEPTTEACRVPLITVPP